MTKKYQNEIRMRLFEHLFLGALFTGVLLMGMQTIPAVNAQSPAPTPTPDRLAEPPLSENPTQYEQGTWLFWYHCMPCHGDVGQGLTEDFIELWPPDHQNCWGRGCHGGKMEDEGFPIPKTVPAVIGEGSGGQKYGKPDALYNYLYTTHPPQSPGYLTEEDYWAIADFVLVRNHLLSEETEIGTESEAAPPSFYRIPVRGFLF